MRLLYAACLLAAAEDLDHRAAAIRPTAAELRWTDIPWLGSLAEACVAAESERRPIFVWGADDDPFERC